MKIAVKPLKFLFNLTVYNCVKEGLMSYINLRIYIVFLYDSWYGEEFFYSL